MWRGVLACRIVLLPRPPLPLPRSLRRGTITNLERLTLRFSTRATNGIDPNAPPVKPSAVVPPGAPKPGEPRPLANEHHHFHSDHEAVGPDTLLRDSLAWSPLSLAPHESTSAAAAAASSASATTTAAARANDAAAHANDPLYKPQPTYSGRVNAILRANTSFINEALPMLHFERDGSFVLSSSTRGELLNTTGIHLRDLRYIDGTHTHVKTITVRETAILVNLEHVQAIVLRSPPCDRDRVMLFNCQRPVVRYFATKLRRHLSALDNVQAVLPFHMHVLEAMLFSVAQRFERQLRNLGPVVDDLLLNLTEQTSESVLRRLLPIKNSLTDFEFNVNEVRSEIVELLASNDNIASLCQPILDAKTPQEQARREQLQLKEIEMMLENFSRQLYEVVNEINKLKKNIEATVEVINVNLDAIRNRIIRLSLNISMVTVALTCGSISVGAFGMNLPNGFEQSLYAFPTAIGATGLGMMAVYGICLLFYRSSQGERKKSEDHKTLARLLPYLDDIEHLVHMRQKMGQTQFDRATFEQMLSEATGKVVEAKDVDLVFRVLDENRDGYLSHGEFLALLQRKRRGEV